MYKNFSKNNSNTIYPYYEHTLLKKILNMSRHDRDAPYYFRGCVNLLLFL